MKLSPKKSLNIILNYISLGLMAISGIIVNLTLLFCYGPEVLGTFNTHYAFLMVLSQLATLGIHYSALRQLSISGDDILESRKIVSSALLLVTFLGGIIVVLLFCLKSYLNQSFQQIGSLQQISPVIIAIPLFALNKVLLFSVNGLSRWRFLAFGQALRYSLMIAFTLVFSLCQITSTYFSWIFFISELLLFLCMFVIVFVRILKFSFVCSWAAVKNHLIFGIRSSLAGLCLEMNSRVDVLILSIFVTKATVGVYSFVMMIIEGLALCFVPLRNWINPCIARSYAEGKIIDFQAKARKLKKYSYFSIFLLFFLTLTAYHILINLVPNLRALKGSEMTLILGGVSLLSVAGYLPFTDFLIQANLPKKQSLQNLVVLLSNMILCFSLIPLYGLNGAVIASTVSGYWVLVSMSHFLLKKNGWNFFSMRSEDVMYG